MTAANRTSRTCRAANNAASELHPNSESNKMTKTPCGRVRGVFPKVPAVETESITHQQCLLGPNHRWAVPTRNPGAPRRAFPQEFFLGAPPSLISSQEFSPPARPPGLPSGPLYPAVISSTRRRHKSRRPNPFTESRTRRIRTLRSSCTKPCDELWKGLADQPN